MIPIFVKISQALDAAYEYEGLNKLRGPLEGMREAEITVRELIYFPSLGCREFCIIC